MHVSQDLHLIPTFLMRPLRICLILSDTFAVNSHLQFFRESLFTIVLLQQLGDNFTTFSHFNYHSNIDSRNFYDISIISIFKQFRNISYVQ